MFGRRPDGRAVKHGIDHITGVVPHIMTKRNDAMNFCTQYFDSEILSSYVRRKRAEGRKMSQMSVMLAAYVRAISQMPQLNRFVVGRTIYARNELCVSFAMVKAKGKNDFLETTVKVYFDPADTVFDVSRKVEETIAKNKDLDNNNKTDRVAKALLKVPGLIRVGAGILKFLDKFGLMPRLVVDASPFHTSMFITNLASINLGSLYHHLYNFGTTTVFLGLGKKEPRVKIEKDGSVSAKYMYPVGVVTDERIAPGAIYGMAFQLLQRYLTNPELLETPPEEVFYDDGVEYRCRPERVHS